MTQKEIYKEIFKCKDMIAAAKRQKLFAALPAIYKHKNRLECYLLEVA